MTGEANDELVYCLRGTVVCQTHRVPLKAREADINKQLAALTSSGPALLAKAVITAVWGDELLAARSCACSWEQRRVEEGGNGADWKLVCACDAAPLLAEHKPDGAVPHWKRTRIAAFTGPGVDPSQRERMSWAHRLDPHCDEGDRGDGVHAGVDCKRNHPLFYRDTEQARRIAGPQILADFEAQGNDNPVTVITDRSRGGVPMNVNEIWGTDLEEYPIPLDTARFPIRSTATVLDRIGEVVDGRLGELTAEQRADLRCVVEAMWMRAGAPELGAAGRKLLRPAAVACAAGEPHELVAWGAYRSQSGG